jgi:hypothetical protein
MSKTAEEIDKEITDLAKSMVKSVTDSKQLLFDTIMELGPDNLKKAVQTLSDSDKELLKACVEDLAKAAKTPEKAPDQNLTPKKTETDANKMKTESLSGSDDEDEKIVDESSADHPHQGGSKDKPEGWEGQIVKGGEGSKGGKVIGHTASGKPIYADHSHASHESFTPQEHNDASDAHLKISDSEWDKHNKRTPTYEQNSSAAAYHRRMGDYKGDRKVEGLTREDHLNYANKHKAEASKHAKMQKSEEPEIEMPAKQAVKEHKQLVNVLESESHADDKKEAKKQKGELKEYQAEMKKSDDKAVNKLIEIEEAEHNKDINGDGKIAEKLEKEAKMKKSLEEIVVLAKSLNMSKEDVVKAIKDSNEDLELVKGKMKEKMEEMKEEAAEPKKEEKSEPKSEKKKEEAAEEKQEPKMEKSINWNLKSSIAANSLGRNTHWDVDAYIEKSEQEKQDIIKKGGYFGETQGETLEKSEGKKADINDLIEKGQDYSTDEIKRIEGIRDHKIEGKVVKSFLDEDIAAALGMSKEEYIKLMGE